MKKIKELIIRFSQFIKFCFTGVINTLITLSLFYILTYKFKIFYLLANVISYIAGMINSYIMNRKWVFKSDNSVIKSSAKFLVINLLSLGLSTLLLHAFVKNLNLNKMLSQIITTGMVMIINYFGNKLWTFRKSR